MYTSQTNIESALGRTLTTDEAAYFTNIVLPSVNAYIDSETGTSFGNDTIQTVSVSGDDTNLLVIPTMYEVTSVEDEDGTPLNVGDYALYPLQAPYMAIKSKTGTWTKGLGNYAVNGKLGYSFVPDEIVKIATDLAVSSYTMRTDGVKSERVGDWSQTFETSTRSLSNDALNTLTRYKRLSRGI